MRLVGGEAGGVLIVVPEVRTTSELVAVADIAQTMPRHSILKMAINCFIRLCDLLLLSVCAVGEFLCAVGEFLCVVGNLHLIIII